MLTLAIFCQDLCGNKKTRSYEILRAGLKVKKIIEKLYLLSTQPH